MTTISEGEGTLMDPRKRAPTALAQGRIAVLRLEGELGCAELADVGAELFRQVARGRIRIVLDLSAVPHLDYRGVRPLMSRAELLQRNGGDVKLVGLTPYLERVLYAGGAYEAFLSYRSVDAALAAFERPLLRVA